MSGRFSRLPAAAVTDTSLSDKTLRVLGVLGIYADAGGLAYPSVPTLAKILTISERQVQRHLRILESAGHVITERTIRHTAGGWGRNRYLLQYRPVALPAPAPNSDDDVEGIDPSGEEPKRTTGRGSANEREVTSRMSPRPERGDAQDVTSGGCFQGSEVTSGQGRGDISRGGEVTPWMSDKQPNEESAQCLNQPNGRAGDIFDEMFRSILPTHRTKFDEQFDADMARARVITVETEPAASTLLGKGTEPASNIVPIQPAPAPKTPWRKPVIEFYTGTDVYWSNRFAKAKSSEATLKVSREWAEFEGCTDAERRARWPEAFAPYLPAEPSKAPTLQSPRKFATWLGTEMDALAVDADTLGTATGLGSDGIQAIRSGKATITSTTRGKILAALDSKRSLFA